MFTLLKVLGKPLQYNNLGGARLMMGAVGDEEEVAIPTKRRSEFGKGWHTNRAWGFPSICIE